MKTIKIKIRGKIIEVEPRKLGESRKDYREYLEECYRTKFPYKKYRKFRVLKRIKQFNHQEKALDKMERVSYNYSFKKDNINFDGPDCLMRIIFGRRAKKNKNVETVGFIPNLLSKKEKTKKQKKENKVVGFFKNLFNRKNKNVETEEEIFEENIHQDDIIFEENIHEDDIQQVEKHPEQKEEKISIDRLPNVKSSRDLNKEEVRNMSVMSQLRYLQEQNKNQAEIINSTINNFNVYLENFRKLEQENLKLRKEITRLSYNPNSFVVRNDYEEAVKEDKIRTMNNIYNSFVNDNKDYIHDDLTANQYNVDKVKVLTRK